MTVHTGVYICLKNNTKQTKTIYFQLYNECFTKSNISRVKLSSVKSCKPQQCKELVLLPTGQHDDLQYDKLKDKGQSNLNIDIMSGSKQFEVCQYLQMRAIYYQFCTTGQFAYCLLGSLNEYPHLSGATLFPGSYTKDGHKTCVICKDSGYKLNKGE